MILDPASHNGYMRMPNGAEVLGYDSNLELYSAGSGAAKNGLKVVPTGIVIANMPAPPAGLALRWLGWDPMSGRVYAVSGGTGGPLGSWAWPFHLSTVTSEYGPRSGRFHEGIDEGNAPAVSGASIRAIGSGTVEVAGYHSDTGFGWYVIVNHGLVAGRTVKSVYGHMIGPPAVLSGQSVTSSTVLGGVGNTGGSYGAHLHLEIHECAPGGSIIWDTNNPSFTSARTAVNPRDFMTARGATGG